LASVRDAAPSLAIVIPVAGPATVTPPLPNAKSVRISTVPDEIVVPPANELLVEIVSVAGPVFTRAPEVIPKPAVLVSV